jgi:hypothetical protein
MRRVALLHHHGVVPVMVFDGAYLPSKASKEDERRACVRRFFCMLCDFAEQFVTRFAAVSATMRAAAGLRCCGPGSARWRSTASRSVLM